MSLKNLNSKSIKNRDGSDAKIGDKTATLRECAIEALLATYPDERQDGVESSKRYDIFLKIDMDGEIEISSEEVSLIKALIGKRFPPLAVGQFYKLIEE